MQEAMSSVYHVRDVKNVFKAVNAVCWAACWGSETSPADSQNVDTMPASTTFIKTKARRAALFLSVAATTGHAVAPAQSHTKHR